MSVQVNGRYLVQRVTGMQRYAREIVARRESDCHVIRPAGGLKGSIGHSWEQFVLPCRLQRGLLWSPCSTGPLAVRNQVVTIHDCAYHDQAECFSRSFAAWLQYLVPRLARRVEHIITVSQFSAERIIELCRVPAEKVTVVHNGLDPMFQPPTAEQIASTRERLRLPAAYVLCVGSLEPRKNLRRLLSAWQQFGSEKDGLKLVLVGAGGSVYREAKLEPPADVLLAGYVADDDLPAVYGGAEAFVYPSLYEGFGLPVIEAMACGTPVVCSNTTSLKEVAVDASIGVDPLSEAAIADGLRQLLGDTSLRAELRARGLARAKEFHWDRAAEETWNVLTRAAV